MKINVFGELLGTFPIDFKAVLFILQNGIVVSFKINEVMG